MKILAIAYACNPYRGSENGVGWGWVKMIAQSHEVHVVAAKFEKPDIEHWLDHNPEYKTRMHFYFPEHRLFHYHNRSKFWLKVENSPFKIIMNMAYRLWQRDAYRLAYRPHQENKYDLCHLITYVGFRFPGRFYQLDCPFVWGPIGGLENTPKHFLNLFDSYGKLYYSFRNAINTLDKKYPKHPKKAFQKAAATGAVIAATSSIQQEIRRWYGVQSNVICEIGPPQWQQDIQIQGKEPGEPLRICWSGLHMPRKALNLLLAALARIPGDIGWRLDVIGEGPCTNKWKSLACELGVNERCNWHGWVKRDQAFSIMEKSHLFVITSLQDLTSTVLLEAMTLGKPVIAPDHCGFSDVITGECGIKIPIKSLNTFVKQLSFHIRYLYENEDLRKQMSQAALRRVNQFGWDKKMQSLNRIYMQAVQNSSS